MSTVNQPELLRIAMWSGPRNISTGMMRSWGNRADTVVVDEPLYAYYLKATGKDHPMAQEVIVSGETDWQKVVADLTGSQHKGLSHISPRKGGSHIVPHIFYQKHMTHHLLPEMGRDWLAGLTNCFLIRDPAEVIASYTKKNEDPTLEDVGFVQQADIFDWERERSGKVPPVIDARDVLQDPERTLRLLCDAIGTEFDRAMLSWSSGLRETDGVWAKHWYGEVAKSTGFEPYRARATEVPERLRDIEARCRSCYEQLYQHRLR